MFRNSPKNFNKTKYFFNECFTILLVELFSIQFILFMCETIPTIIFPNFVNLTTINA